MGNLFAYCMHGDDPKEAHTVQVQDSHAPLMQASHLETVAAVGGEGVKDLNPVGVEEEETKAAQEEKTESKPMYRPVVQDAEEEGHDENSNQSLLNLSSASGKEAKGERKFFNKNIPVRDNSMPRVAPAYIMEGYSLEHFKTVLIKGFQVRKFSRKGSSKVLHVWCNLDHSSLLWKSNKTKSKAMSPGFDPTTSLYHFDLTKVTDIVRGVGAFRSLKPSHAGKCFSLVSDSRSLDIQCGTDEEADFLFRGFSDLLHIDGLGQGEVREVKAEQEAQQEEEPLKEADPLKEVPAIL